MLNPWLLGIYALWPTSHQLGSEHYAILTDGLQRFQLKDCVCPPNMFGELFPAWKHRTHNVVSRKITLSALDVISSAVSTDCESFSPLLFLLPHRSECHHCTLQRRRHAHGQAVMVLASRGMWLNCAASLGTRQMAMHRKGEAFSPICTLSHLLLHNIWHQIPPSWRPNQRACRQRAKQGPQPQERMTGLTSETLPAGEGMGDRGQGGRGC